MVVPLYCCQHLWMDDDFARLAVAVVLVHLERLSLRFGRHVMLPSVCKSLMTSVRLTTD